MIYTLHVSEHTAAVVAQALKMSHPPQNKREMKQLRTKHKKKSINLTVLTLTPDQALRRRVMRTE